MENISISKTQSREIHNIIAFLNVSNSIHE